MDGVAALYSSGRIVDIVLLFILIEFLVLALLHRRTKKKGIAPGPMASNLLSATFLLLALRAAILDYPWMWTAAFLFFSFPAHLVDLGVRWRQ